jgi:YfiH family protein
MSEPAAVFELPGGGRALFTTRAHGNLSAVQGEHHEQAAATGERLAAEIGLERLGRARQVHGTHIHRWRAPVDDAPAAAPVADGHATALPSLGVMVLGADCLPVALGARGAIAMLHAGWRGLAGGVLERGVEALVQEGGSGEIVAVLGPCAGACCYEVGPEVQAAFGREPVKGVLDLRAIARDRLLAAGVADVLDAGACTICDERFFSHRREGAAAGRQAGVAWLT